MCKNCDIIEKTHDLKKLKKLKKLLKDNVFKSTLKIINKLYEMELIDDCSFECIIIYISYR